MASFTAPTSSLPVVIRMDPADSPNGVELQEMRGNGDAAVTADGQRSQSDRAGSSGSSGSPNGAGAAVEGAIAASPLDLPAPSDLLFSFSQLSVASRHPAQHLLANVSGYVRRGGLTALVGASGSGKTLLMQALCGRLPELATAATITIDGKRVNANDKNKMGFVAQEDELIGELTVRETFRISARLRLSASDADIERDVEALIAGLGLSHVADNVIGTLLKRGLSGGEKRRVSVGVELAARPTVICLDEPTSGLDASSAYVVLRSIQRLARNSNGRLCILASIHQPNSRLLSLFDDLLVLGRGSMVYFGPTKQALPHFAQLGFVAPAHLTPTDFIVHIVDQRFRQAAPSSSKNNNKQLARARAAAAAAENKKQQLQLTGESASSSGQRVQVQARQVDVEVDCASTQPAAPTQEQRAYDFDFPVRYQLSELGSSVQSVIESVEREQQQSSALDLLDNKPDYETSWLRQFSVLADRFFMQARRDVTLYILQFVLCCGFGFAVGAEFYMLPIKIGTRLQDVTMGIVWLVFVCAYLQVFKIYYLMLNKQRFQHEHANRSYAVSAWSAADFLVTSFCSFLTFIPGLMIAYFMMGLPAESAGFAILMLFTTTMASESLVELVCQLFTYTPTAILMGQGTLVVLCVFAGGAFIDWSRLGFWIWLSECSFYTWATRGMMVHIFRNLDYSCPAELISGAGSCDFNGLRFPLSAGNSVRGPDVLYVSKGMVEADEWYQWGILFLLMALFRLATYVLLRWPLPLLHSRARRFLGNSRLIDTMLQQQAMVQTLLARVQVLEQPTVEAAVPAPATNPACGPSPLAEVALPIRAATSFHSSSCPLHWKNLNLSLRSNNKILVDNLVGEAQPGRVLAIMGPSGAGKTTLLNALSGRAPYARISGSVLLGDAPLNKSHLDFVQQYDSLNPMYTVKDSLCIMAKLKNSISDCRERVSELLHILGLTQHANTLVRELSSGDRKRLSIGLSLISNPSVLFLDEPTTGLDSEAALVVIEYLIKVTRSTGVVTVLTIHQPSAAIFDQLDDLLLLSRGKMAYMGAAAEANAYFTAQGFPVPPQTNPSDFYLDLMNAKTRTQVYLEPAEEDEQGDEAEQPQSRPPVAEADSAKAAAQSVPSTSARVSPEPSSQQDSIPEWRGLLDASRWRYTATPGNAARSAPEPERPSELSRLSVLVRSRLLYFWTERAIYLLRLVQMILLAVYVGTIFLRVDHSILRVNEIAGAMFFSVWLTLFAAISATPVFVRDRATFENEFLNGCYGLSAHVGSTLLASLPYHLVTAAVFQSILWFLVGFNDSFEPWLFAVLSTFVQLLLMEGVSLLLVHFLPGAMLSTSATMVCLGMLFLFNGFFVRVTDSVASIAWLSWVMPTKYVLDSLLRNIFHGQSYDNGAGGLIDGDDLADSFFKLDDRPKWGDWAIVAAFAIAMRLAHLAALNIRYRQFQGKKLADDEAAATTDQPTQ